MTARSLIHALCLVIAGPVFAGTNCPLNQMSTCTTDSSGLSVDSRHCGGCNQFGCTSINAGYSIPAGTLSAGAGGNGDIGDCGSVLVQDDFSVQGLAPGTPVALVAHMSVNLTQCEAHLKDAFAHDVAAFGDYTGLLTDLTLAVPATSGVAFRLSFELRGCSNSTFGGGGGNANFSFTGLPPGAAVVSCNGYTSGTAVPTASVSWSKLKSMYR